MAKQEREGRRATVRFDSRRCIHSQRCVMAAPAAFNPERRPWIDPDAADADALMQVAVGCPSGAITVERTDGGAAEGAPPVNLVTLRENGPLAFHADMILEEHGPMFRATLCRCGLSKRKPFCDNSHIDTGFTATGEPPSRETKMELAEICGPVEVTPLRDGPLKVSGAVEVATGTGRTVARIRSAFFCRCGNSQNKPFCDGSHKRVGFRSAD